MSFLKQLLNPFIEFDEDGKKREPQPAKPTPAAPTPAPPKPAAAAPMPAEQPTEHPLITGGAAAAAPPIASAQVPTYNASGTLSVPLPEHVAYFEKLVDDA